MITKSNFPCLAGCSWYSKSHGSIIVYWMHFRNLPILTHTLWLGIVARLLSTWGYVIQCTGFYISITCLLKEFQAEMYKMCQGYIYTPGLACLFIVKGNHWFAQRAISTNKSVHIPKTIFCTHGWRLKWKKRLVPFIHLRQANTEHTVFTKVTQNMVKITHVELECMLISQNCTQMSSNISKTKQLHIFLSRHMNDHKNLFLYKFWTEDINCCSQVNYLPILGVYETWAAQQSVVTVVWFSSSWCAIHFQ